MAKTGQRHAWIENDDVIAYYLYRVRWDGAPALSLREDEIAKVLGMSEASLIMRQANFASLAGKGGLNHLAPQSQRIYERHKQTTNAELRSVAIRLLEAEAR